ncbi:MAG TPA: hypothetical protein VF607_01495 [Verrucomicrobiae bacterium]
MAQLAPDFPAAYTKLASLALDKGDLAETERLVSIALRLDEESSEGHDLLGQLRERQGLLPKALPELDKAVRLAHDNAIYKEDPDRLKQVISRTVNP